MQIITTNLTNVNVPEYIFLPRGFAIVLIHQLKQSIMKLSGLIAIVAFTVTKPVYAQQPLAFIAKDSIYIKGSISGFTSGQQDGFVSFTTAGINGETKKQAIQIAANGSFSAALYQPFAGDITFNYKNAFVSLYATPADTLILKIDDKLMDRQTGYRNAITAWGKQDATNNILLQFQSTMSMHSFKAQANIGDKTLGDAGFAEKRTARMNEELAYLDGYITTNRITDATFKTWQKNQLMYTAAKEMVLYPFFGKMNKDISPAQLSALIKNIPVENQQALHNSAYYDFLKMLALGEQIIININPAFDEAKKQNGYNPIPLYLDRIDQTYKGISRQLMYYDTYSPNSKYNTDELKARFSAAITEPTIRQKFSVLLAVPVKFATYNLTARIMAAKVSDSLKTKLAGLFNRYKGNNLYLDFWGDWCGPCMSEMPGYPATIAVLKDQPLKFIFLSAHTTTESMLAIKAKFGIDADFINLSNNEVAILNNVLDFHSYPSHFVIDSTGNVISNSARSAEQVKKVLAH